MRLLLAPLLTLATCGAPAAMPSEPAPAVSELPACPGLIVEKVGDEPLTCDINPTQTLIRTGGGVDCVAMGGTLYVSEWPDRAELCIDIDF